MNIKEKDSLRWYHSEVFSPEVVHGFSTKLGGVSTGDFAGLNLVTSRGDSPQAVAENYTRFAQAVGFSGEKYARNAQIHSDICRVVTQGMGLSDFVQGDRQFPEGDGLLTQEKNLALWAYSADCVPILYHDPVTQSIAAVHAGWRGTALAIASKMVKEMTSAFATNPADLQVSLGPSIGPCCFSCHEEVPQAFRDAMGEDAETFIKSEGQGKFSVDLQGINGYFLKKSGVTQIDTHVPCTACHGEEFWSHRIIGDKRGSMGGMIALKGENL